MTIATSLQSGRTMLATFSEESTQGHIDRWGGGGGGGGGDYSPPSFGYFCINEIYSPQRLQ